MKTKQQKKSSQLLKDVILVFIVVIIGLAIITAVIVAVTRKSEKLPATSVVVPVNSGPLGLRAPYESIDDISGIWPYSPSDQTQLGSLHKGLDFIVEKDRVPFYAIADGVVDRLDVSLSQPVGNYQVNVYINVNETYAYGMGFEMFSKKEVDATAQMEAMEIELGQQVKQGQLIGYLLYRGDGAHVHISVRNNREDFCYFSLFPEVTQEEIAAKLRIPGRVTPRVCYE